MISTLILAPGIVVNLIIKDYSGRPRPWSIVEFGGKEQFRPWWDLRGPCESNCSFVAGEPSGAFWTMAPAAVAPPGWQAAGYGAAILFGLAVGVMRMASRRALLQRCGVRGSCHLSDHLARAWAPLPLAADASYRRGDRARSRTHWDPGPRRPDADRCAPARRGQGVALVDSPC